MKEYKQLELDFDGKIEAAALAKKKHKEFMEALSASQYKYTIPIWVNSGSTTTVTSSNYINYTYTSNNTNGTGNWR